MNLHLNFTLHAEFNLKWVRDEHMRSNYYKMFRGKHRRESLSYRVRQRVLRCKKHTNHYITDKLDFKIKHFAVWKQSKNWKKIFASHISYRELVSRIYNELSKLNRKQASNLIKKWAKGLNNLPMKI